MSEPILLDTNILIFAHDIFSPNQQQAKDILFSALAENLTVVLSTQNLLEFYSVITNQKRVAEALPPTKAQNLVDEYLSSEAFTIIHPPIDPVFKAFALATKHKLAKEIIFDAYLVATMLYHGVRVIYTDNERHFKIFKEVKVINPFKS